LLIFYYNMRRSSPSFQRSWREGGPTQRRPGESSPAFKADIYLNQNTW
jgi:hypothetical protein